MIYVIADGEYSVPTMEVIRANFVFRPQETIERLNLRKMKYMPTAIYGHFTNPDYPWERVIQI